MAHQSGGVFYLRIEDTDRKREVEGGDQEIINALHTYDIYFDEGLTMEGTERGNYGPYKQSQREDIYKAYVKYMIEKGNAYPCFCKEDEMELSRAEQEALKVRKGYYGKWATCRNMSFDEVQDRIAKGQNYIIRLKSPGNWDNKIILDDLIKGRVELSENDQDIVILKSDGLPTYHFAHAVDDHLMGTTHVTRGVEWLPSASIHIQLFKLLGFDLPRFAHISPILKMDGNSKRKLSKRKDPEIAFSYYNQLGYPKESVIEYLLCIINSNFEEWRRENPSESYREFIVRFDKISPGGSLFDTNKLNDISKNVIAYMSAAEIYELYLKWAIQYDNEMAELLVKDREYAIRFFSIDKNIPKPRKDFVCWMDVKEGIGYYYDELFYKRVKEGYDFISRIIKRDIIVILQEYLKIYNPNDDKTMWFERIRNMAEGFGYAKDMKAFKRNPENFKGNVADISTIIRIAITNRANSPDLYEIMNIIGSNRTMERIENAIIYLQEKGV
jgi:glutamyl-tRNA synthetase